MRLTLWTDYALRTLIYVGANAGRLSTIAEIAESFDISNAHLMKIVNKLAQQGYLQSVRGGIDSTRGGSAQPREAIYVEWLQEDNYNRFFLRPEFKVTS
jgi:Rrf2 family nitric oxide-sensitive transcriptional repressor